MKLLPSLLDLLNHSSSDSIRGLKTSYAYRYYSNDARKDAHAWVTLLKKQQVKA